MTKFRWNGMCLFSRKIHWMPSPRMPLRYGTHLIVEFFINISNSDINTTKMESVMVRGMSRCTPMSSPVHRDKKKRTLKNAGMSIAPYWRQVTDSEYYLTIDFRSSHLIYIHLSNDFHNGRVRHEKWPLWVFTCGFFMV